jgi:predicted dehydrogenase
MKTNFAKDERLLRVGVLGCGTISQAGHFISAVKAKNTELYAICDVSESLLNKMNDIYAPKKCYNSFDDMLKDDNVEAVVIGIGDQFHTDCTFKALEAGKHVLVEKPIGVSVKETEKVVKKAREKGLIVQVGNMKRFDPGIEYAKDFTEKHIGKVTTYKGWYCDSSIRYTLCDNVMPIIYSSPDMKKPKGNPKQIKDRYYLLGHASHLFDTAQYLLGDIECLSAKLNVADNMYSWLISCDFASGVIGSLDLTIAIRAPWHEGFEIYGTNGTVFAKTPNPWELVSSQVECWRQDTETCYKPFAADGHVFRRQLEAFADVILNNAPQKGASAEDGLKALKCLIATYQSVNENGKTIKVKDVQGEI